MMYNPIKYVRLWIKRSTINWDLSALHTIWVHL